MGSAMLSTNLITLVFMLLIEISFQQVLPYQTYTNFLKEREHMKHYGKENVDIPKFSDKDFAVEEYFPNRRKYKKQSYSNNVGSIDSIQNSNTFRFANKKISLDTGAILGQLGFKLFEFAQYAVLSSI